ncbi:UpxY family transcription antiterminator [uncultured Sunxiuqinia sp.]|uniref:UpxY family transcription antiterminator n=1 Tax=uncultured Sunxiuqinia sp. TaxID=1573825 RepID=UPI0030DC793F|tara:strand:- start:30495 stop:31019 length:525 start_codon:yes stop_codon:yes gene_type:complete
MMKNGDYKWHAVYVKSRAEKKSLGELIRRGIEAYLPLQVSKRQWSDRVKIVEEPLLRGYLFVRVSYREYVEVLKVSGVMAFISFGNEPAKIPEKQINDLKLFIEKVNSAVHVTNENIAKGQKVRVVAGALAGIEGEISEVRGKKRIVLRFDKLGCSIFADVSTQFIEKVEPIES